MEIILTEGEAQLLLESALDNQTALLTNIKEMKKDPDFDKSDIYHFQSKHARYEDVIVSLSRKLTFST